MYHCFHLFLGIYHNSYTFYDFFSHKCFASLFLSGFFSYFFLSFLFFIVYFFLFYFSLFVFLISANCTKTQEIVSIGGWTSEDLAWDDLASWRWSLPEKCSETKQSPLGHFLTHALLQVSSIFFFFFGTEQIFWGKKCKSWTLVIL